jgi:hypothetical protein
VLQVHANSLPHLLFDLNLNLNLNGCISMLSE